MWQPESQEYNVSSCAQSLDVKAKESSRWESIGAQATAETRYDFIPLTDELILNFTGQLDMNAFENSLTFTLIIVDGNFEVNARIWQTEDPLNINESINCNGLVPGSVYRFLLTAIGSPGDTPGVTSHLKTQFY